MPAQTRDKNGAPPVVVDEFGVQRVNAPHAALMWDPSEPDSVRLYDGIEVGTFGREAVRVLLPALRTFAEFGTLVPPPVARESQS